MDKRMILEPLRAARLEQTPHDRTTPGFVSRLRCVKVEARNHV